MDHGARELETEVAIVGAGPVGLLLAALLGARGVRCVVLERRPRGTPAFPTANHVSVRTMEHLRRLGLSREVSAAFRPGWGGDWIAVTCLGGHEVARVEGALAGAAPRADSPEREVWAPKPCFDPILERAAAGAASIRLLHGVRVEEIAEEGDAVRCTARDTRGAAVRVSARFCVGCDGAASSVRQACGVGMLGPPPLTVRVHSAFFRSRRVAERVPRGGVQVMLLGTPRGPTKTPFGAGLMVAVDGRELWRLHGPGLDADDEAATLEQLRALGADDAEILATSVWTPSQALCTSFRAGRVLLAGDAAHVVAPFGGLGVNTGMADAVDLAWKIEATLGGWGGPKLLGESYDFERRLAALDLLAYQGVDFSGERPERLRPPLPLYDAPGETLWRPGEEGEAARLAYGRGLVASRGDEFEKPQIDLGTRYDGSPIVQDDGSPLPDRSDARVYRPTAKPGGRAPHVVLPDGRSILDLYGDGFVLLRTDARVEVSAFERSARARRVPLRVETVPGARLVYERTLTLVRPDGVVAWRADALPEAPGAVVDRVRGV